jgi:hypothetical protein
MDNPVVEAPAPEDEFIDSGTLLIAGSIFVAVVVGGAFFLAIQALDALKVSVPQQTITEVGTQIVNVIQKTMSAARTQSDASPSPIDNLFVAAAQIPADYLIAEIQRRALTPEQRAIITAVVQRKDSEIGSIG